MWKLQTEIKYRAIAFLYFRQERKCRKLANYIIANKYKRIYFYHVRKASGTSLNHMFLSLAGEEDIHSRLLKAKNKRAISNKKIYVGWNKVLIERGNYFYAFSHIPMHKLRLPDKTFTITCLRDPASRIISHYKMLIEIRSKNPYHPLIKTEGKWLGNSFSEFITRIPKTHFMNQLYMFSKNFNVEEAFNNITLCSHFFFTEDFRSGIDELTTKIELKLEPMRKRMSSVDVGLKDTDIDHLKFKLAPEYRLIDTLRNYKYK